MDKTSTPARIPFLIKLCLWAGLACTAQFFILGLFGVIRGYSVQSLTPVWVMLAGVYLLIPCTDTIKSLSSEKKKPASRLSFLISFSIIVFSITGILQGHFRRRGDELYKQKNYPAAIAMYQEEINTWYLRLSYNYNEDVSLFGIAQSYCQLENFEQARKTYQHLVKMARGYYHERGSDELDELDRELANIAAFENQLANAADDNQKADILFDMALSYRRIKCTKKAREQYALIQTLHIRESTKEQAAGFAADLLL